MCAVLCGEPYHLRPWEIARLTPYQVRHHYFRPRDERGALVRPPPPGEAGAARFDSYRDKFWYVWGRRGLTEAEIVGRWEAYQKEQGAARGR